MACKSNFKNLTCIGSLSLKALEQPACFAVAIILHEAKWAVFSIFMKYDVRPVLKI